MILINKPKYLTSYQAILKFKNQNPTYKNVKLGYVGTLDPMATGLLIALEDKENKDRNKYIGLTKTYEFEILFGISTDSYDLLGLLKKIDPDYENKIESLDINQFVGKYIQKFPPFSAKIINGKRLYNLSRNNLITESELPSFEREIFSLEVIQNQIKTKQEILDEIKTATKQIDGDFRQNEIINSWVEKSKQLNESYKLVKIKTLVSSGTYIRRLCVDIADKYNSVALAYSINRTKVGDYDLKNAIQIDS